MRANCIPLVLMIFLASLLPSNVNAQGPADALRYSFITPNGTARYVSMGGAFGALGADFTSLSYNPAGLGVYRSSEFMLTPSFRNRVTDSEFGNNSYTDTRTGFGFDNVGFITSFSNQKSDAKGLTMVNFGVGYNRLIDFNSETIASGTNTSNSIMDYFAGRANGFNYNNLTKTADYDPFTSSSAPWDAVMAWNTFLLDTIPGQTNSYWAALNAGDGVEQEQSISTQGSLGEFVISIASNFSDKLFLGATIGVQNLYYSQTITHNETAFTSNNATPNGYRFNELQYKQTLDVEGAGFNFKVGAIFRPVEFLRVGLALHTPTYYALDEDYRASIKSNFIQGSYDLTSPLNRYDYGIESPFRMIGSLAFTYLDKGLLSFDAEYVDYTTMRINEGGDGNTFISENKEIKEIYRTAYNIKGGGEFWLGDVALRAGYSWFGSPYASNHLNAESNVTLLSGGLGYKMGGTFIDFTYQRMLSKDSYYFYNLNNSDGSSAIDPVVRSINQGKVLLTVGFKF